MDLQEIEVTIDKNGKVIIHVRGVKGNKCLDLTRDLEKILGAQVVQRNLTSEALEDDSGNQISTTVQTGSPS